MLILLGNANEACSFSGIEFRDANWVNATGLTLTHQWLMYAEINKHTATITSIGWKSTAVQWEDNVNYRRRGNDARELWRPANSDKKVWMPLDAAGKFNAFNASRQAAFQRISHHGLKFMTKEQIHLLINLQYTFMKNKLWKLGFFRWHINRRAEKMYIL